MPPSLHAQTLTIDRQITGVVHHYTPPDSSGPGSPGYVTDEIEFDTTGLTNVDLDQYQTFKLRLFTAAGQKVSVAHAESYRSALRINFITGMGTVSHDEPAVLEFENFAGSMPTRDYSRFRIGDFGSSLIFQADELYPGGGTGFTAMSYSFTPAYNPANSPKDFTMDWPVGYPLCFSYQTTATTDPGPLVSLAENGPIPQLLNYQGRIARGTPAVNFEGPGQFKFALVNTDGTETFWSNDGTSSAGSEPAAAVTLQVTKGLYSVLLGDILLPHMTAIPMSVFTHGDVRLRVWFNDGTNGSQLLTPDQRIAAVGYAMMAANVKDGAITSAKLAEGAVGSTALASGAVQGGHIATGAVGANQLATGAVGASNIATGAVGSDQLASAAVRESNIAAGAVGTNQMADFAITSSKLRPGYVAGTLANGTIEVAPGVFAFSASFACPFSVAPAVSLLTPGWALGPVTPSGFSATLSYPPQIIKQISGILPPAPGRFISLAVVAGGLPAVSYYDGTRTLKYVHAADPRGTMWDQPGPITIDNTVNAGQYSSLAVVAGNPAIAYHAAGTADLKYASSTDPLGMFWNPPVTIDSIGNVGQYVSLAEVDGYPAISYYDATNTSLKFIRAKDPMGMEWEQPLTLDSTNDVGAYGSLAVINGNPAISYHDTTNGDLKYIRATDATGSAWGPPLTVDTGDTANVGTYTSLTVVDGNPAISYYDITNGVLKYVRATDANGTAWNAPLTPDNTGSVGAYSSMQVVNGRPAISYYDTTNGALKYVHASDAAGTAWGSPMILDNTGMTGTHTSLAVVDGVPAVTYYEQSPAPGKYKFAVVPASVPELDWQASDGSIAPLTAASVASGAIGSTQLAPNAVQASNISASAVGSAQLAPNLTVSGALTATSFQGDGSGLTGIPASAVVTAPPGMVLIPAGTFMMGNSVAADTDITNAAPVTVTLSAYYIAINEVTLSQWLSVYYWAKSHSYTFLMNSGYGKGPNHPVVMVSWHDCVKWCNARSEMEGLTPCYYTDASQTTVYKSGEVTIENAWVKWNANGYRLPTEAEWEKAARGGLSGQRFSWGDTINQSLANYEGDTAAYSYDLGPDGYNVIGEVGGYPYTTPVGTFAPNGYGLNDMAGNVVEWCWDWYGTPYAGGSDPRGPASGSYRIGRGGCMEYHAYFSRAAARDFIPPYAWLGIYGFRPARSAVP